jgi:mono/diheme cytochrome c family protein
VTHVKNHKDTKTQRNPLRLVFLLCFVSWCLCGLFASAYAQETSTPKRIWDGIFTAEQARRGKAEFDQTCSRCHNLALIGSDRGPAIKGSTFLSHWDKGSVADLFIKIRDTMPEGGPGTLNEDIKIDILSYILQQNGFPAGTDELKKDLSSLEDIRLTRKGIWDGVFTAAQADRGKSALLQNGCNGCHGPELAGDRGPSLKGERFITSWENGSVNRLFIKIRDTMPPLNAEQVSPNTKLDIIAYLLQVNGFPSGSAELALDSDALDSFQIVRKGADSSSAPNFALVQVLGCLTQNSDGRWVLLNSTEPSVTKDEGPTPASLKQGESHELGSQTFELISVTRSFQAESHKGHKMEARGLLYREPSHAELNLTSLQMVAPGCGK